MTACAVHRGHTAKSWHETVANDMRQREINERTAHDPVEWKAAIKAPKMLHESTIQREREKQEKRKRPRERLHICNEVRAVVVNGNRGGLLEGSVAAESVIGADTHDGHDTDGEKYELQHTYFFLKMMFWFRLTLIS